MADLTPLERRLLLTHAAFEALMSAHTEPPAPDLARLRIRVGLDLRAAQRIVSDRRTHDQPPEDRT
jgi:hypothetical protein